MNIIDAKKVKISNQLYLLFGNEMKNIYKSKICVSSYMGVFFWIINDTYFVVKYEKNYFCSCNQKFCWHVAVIKSNHESLSYISFDLFDQKGKLRK